MSRRPINEIVAESRKLLAALESMQEDLSEAIDSLIAETESQKRRDSNRRLR